MSRLDENYELLRRIDKKDYLTEREHREFLDRLKALLVIAENNKEYIEELEKEIEEKNREICFYKQEISKFMDAIIKRKD